MIKSVEELKLALTEGQNKCLIALNGTLHHESPPLYHYTDLSAGLSILEKSSLRFTDIKYCNDPEEFENGLKIFNRMSDEILNIYLEKSPSFTHVMILIRHILNFSTSFKHIEGQSLLRAKDNLSKFGIDSTKILYKKLSIFVCCLSERGDDLRQWLPYANDGCGVALGFKEMNNNQHNFTIEDNTWAIKVCYESEAKKEKYVIDIFDRAYSVFNDMDPSLIPEFAVNIFRAMLFDIIACKSINYRDEDEWRLIRIENADSGLEEVNFRIKDNIIRPYIEVPIVKESLLEFKLGPKTEDNLNVHALNRVITKFEYTNTKIVKSKISYR